MINEKRYEATSGVVSTDEYREWTYTYDDKNNIYKSVDIPFRWQTEINNILDVTFTEHGEDNPDSYSYSFTYVYNEDNYPSEYIDEGDDEKYVIEYKEK